MESILIFVVIGLFVAMLFVNIYFRVKVLKHFQVLRRAEIPFNKSHIFDEQKMRDEVVSKYPDYEEHLLGFSQKLRYSIKMATVLITLITLFGAILMYFR